MNYIYDVTLNFNRNNLYEFFEWKEEDDLEFILKIPVFKVSIEDLLNIKYSDTIVSKDFLNSIEDKTQVYAPNSVNIIRYACIFSSEEMCVALEFDEYGNSYMKSNLSIEEAEEVLSCAKIMKYTILDYKIKTKRNIEYICSTRTEREDRKNIIKNLEKINKNKEIVKLKYIFYEIYNEKSNDVEKIYSKLMNIAKNNDVKFVKLKNLIDLIENKKIMSNNS